ncbi:hypothetical protein [Nocardioides sp. MH1]|uniref:hypothetical protein n=1 Tax=Nocardioides sp. MH1 TaxID=3242490 RepID=UPI0035216518
MADYRTRKFQKQQNAYAAQSAAAAVASAATAASQAFHASLTPLPPGLALSPSGQHAYIQGEWRPFARNQMGNFWYDGSAWVTAAGQTPEVVVNVSASSEDATAEQVKAVASGSLADALRELNKLRYDRLLSDEEFTVLKSKLMTDYS